MVLAKRTCISAAAAFLLVTIGLPATAGDTYYRWVDENGTPANSDHPPPPGIDYETITTGTGLHRPSPAKEAPLAQQPEKAGETSAEKVAPAQAQDAPKNPEACEAARRNLDTLTTHARIRMRDSDGGFRFINEEEKATQRELAEASIDRECE